MRPRARSVRAATSSKDRTEPRPIRASAGRVRRARHRLLLLQRRQRFGRHLPQGVADRQTLGYPLVAVHVPKTVDNDLPITDNCPGFGSVAKYVATSMREAAFDVASMARLSTKGFVLEVMGRHAGWITAAVGDGGAIADTPIPAGAAVPGSALRRGEVHGRRRWNQGQALRVLLQSACPKACSMHRRCADGGSGGRRMRSAMRSWVAWGR